MEYYIAAKLRLLSFTLLAFALSLRVLNILAVILGRGQVVKAAGFDPAIAGSTPAAPARFQPVRPLLVSAQRLDSRADASNGSQENPSLLMLSDK